MLTYRHDGELWFAWKIVLLQYRKQLVPLASIGVFRCDLLEKSYFCSIANNCIIFHSQFNGVVICLKNRTFAVSQTTNNTTGTAVSVLWFAWKIVLLQYRKQLSFAHKRTCKGCDLLEKSYFCSIANNRNMGLWRRIGLWFAWKIVLLQYRKQHIYALVLVFGCCDLLEKSYFCSIANNLPFCSS